jgi:DNA-binding MarR family transcriptional regulator
MHPSLLLNMLRAVYWYCDALQDNLESQGHPRTTRAMAFVLLNIAQGEHRAINIARNLGISRQAVGQMLEELRSRDFITVREDPSNRRSRIVDFSPAFAEPGAACAEILAKLDAQVSRSVGKRNFESMAQALSRDWGPAPLFPRLTRQELREGRQYWNTDDAATNGIARGDESAPKSRTPQRTPGRAAPKSRSRRSSSATEPTAFRISARTRPE